MRLPGTRACQVASLSLATSGRAVMTRRTTWCGLPGRLGWHWLACLPVRAAETGRRLFILADDWDRATWLLRALSPRRQHRPLAKGDALPRTTAPRHLLASRSGLYRTFPPAGHHELPANPAATASATADYLDRRRRRCRGNENRGYRRPTSASAPRRRARRGRRAQVRRLRYDVTRHVGSPSRTGHRGAIGSGRPGQGQAGEVPAVSRGQDRTPAAAEGRAGGFVNLWLDDPTPVGAGGGARKGDTPAT